MFPDYLYTGSPKVFFDPAKVKPEDIEPQSLKRVAEPKRKNSEDTAQPLKVDRGEEYRIGVPEFDIRPLKKKYPNRPNQRSVGLPISPYVQLAKLNEEDKVKSANKVISEIVKVPKEISVEENQAKSGREANMEFLMPKESKFFII